MLIGTRDNITQITHIQYCSKQGRKTLHKQLSAMLISTFLIIIFQLAVVLPPLIKEMKPFLNCSFSNNSSSHTLMGILWFGGTLQQYLIWIITLTFVIIIAYTFVIFFLSKISQSHIPMLIKGIIVTVLFGFIGYFAIIRAFMAMSLVGGQKVFYDVVHIKFIEVYFCAAVLVISVLFAVCILHKYKRKDLT